MRVHRELSGSLFSYISIEERIPASHPLRRIRKLADQAFDRLNLTFYELYAAEGRPSVPPELLLLAWLLQAFYGIRSVPGVNYVGARLRNCRQTAWSGCCWSTLITPRCYA